jgi:hypothetical protein
MINREVFRKKYLSLLENGIGYQYNDNGQYFEFFKNKGWDKFEILLRKTLIKNGALVDDIKIGLGLYSYKLNTQISANPFVSTGFKIEAFESRNPATSSRLDGYFNDVTNNFPEFHVEDIYETINDRLTTRFLKRVLRELLKLDKLVELQDVKAVIAKLW